jgi:hypothetical protein
MTIGMDDKADDLFDYMETGAEEPPPNSIRRLIHHFLDLSKPELTQDIVNTFQVPGMCLRLCGCDRTCKSTHVTP